MKFTIDKKTIKFLKNHDITAIYLDFKINNRTCCGPSAVDTYITYKNIDTNNPFILYEDIKVYYNELIEMYIKDELLSISSTGISGFRKLYLVNEINSFK